MDFQMLSLDESNSYQQKLMLAFNYDPTMNLTYVSDSHWSISLEHMNKCIVLFNLLHFIIH